MAKVIINLVGKDFEISEKAGMANAAEKIYQWLLRNNYDVTGVSPTDEDPVVGLGNDLYNLKFFSDIRKLIDVTNGYLVSVNEEEGEGVIMVDKDENLVDVIKESAKLSKNYTNKLFNDLGEKMAKKIAKDYKKWEDSNPYFKEHQGTETMVIGILDIKTDDKGQIMSYQFKNLGKFYEYDDAVTWAFKEWRSSKNYGLNQDIHIYETPYIRNLSNIANKELDGFDIGKLLKAMPGVERLATGKAMFIEQKKQAVVDHEVLEVLDNYFMIIEMNK